MKRWIAALLLGLSLAAGAHTVEHQVSSARATVVLVTFNDGEEASFSEFEVFGPGDKQPYQVGRTDAHGRVVFLPDRPGQWTARVKADSQHGLHGVSVTVEVGADGVARSLSQPVVATHTRLLIGVGLLLGLFGAVSLLRRRSPAPKEDG